MILNEKALNREQSEYSNNSIIPEKLRNNKPLPLIVGSFLSCSNIMFYDLNDSMKLNALIVKLAQMFNAKRIKINESGNHVIPNWYGMLYISSGLGKDRLIKIFDNYYFKEFRNWFQKKSDEFYKLQIQEIEKKANITYSKSNIAEEKKRQNYINEEVKKIRKLVLEISNGTQEGLCADAKAFKKAKFGSMFLIISELGNFIGVKTNERIQFLHCIYEAYDGKIINKCIKGEQREPDVDDMPLNALLYSDPTRILTDLKSYIFSLLATGLNRRCMISFQVDTKLKNVTLSDEEERNFYNQATELGKKLFSIFEAIKEDAVFVLLPEAKELLRAYKLKLIDLFNNEDDSNLKTEYKSRELKALKLSGIYACLNHPRKTTIEIEDMQQAIDTVEYLSKDFAKFVNYKVARNDLYDNIFDFFKNNLNKSFTKHELTYKQHREFGIARDKFIKEFDSIIDIVKGVAEENGYFLESKSINKNSGTSYTLILAPQKDNELNQLI